MAVQKVTQVFETGATLNESAHKVFEVSFTSISEDNVIAAASANDGAGGVIPTPGDSFSVTNTAYIAQNPIVKRVGRGPLFEVTVPYVINSSTYGGNKAISPLSRPTEWYSDGQPSSQEIDRDVDGALITNSSYQVLKTMVRHADFYVRAVKNIATHTDYTAYFSRVNNAAYVVDSSGMNKSFPLETLFLSHITQDFVEEEYAGSVIQYHRATGHFYAFISRATGDPTTWRQKILDEGTMKLDATNNLPVAITDPVSNVTITEPVKLNGNGDVNDPADDPWWLDGAGVWSKTPTTFTQVYKTADFSGLPF